MAPKKNVELGNIGLGPIEHQTLPADLIERFKAYKKILGDADQVTVDEAVDGFRRDLNAHKEVAIWERIAHIFQHFTDGHQIADEARRLEVLRALLLISTGAKVQETATLTRDQITELRYNF